ncbi:hypothetical protein QTJ16_006249 [Diplocarpon rosae]|uniref:Uncharacterized protein n=1 Tax=Diplocarpon rosae TaxID=946125 RepID=A0AAD9SWA1_9HELO|nr:hypothetical protein QTJ16_006249 [Diplocarpon rosae]
MVAEESTKLAQAAKEDPAVVLNRLAVAMAKREAMISSWETSSSRSKPRKTQEELDAEDAILFRNEPPHLGVGAPLPAEFLACETERSSKALRAKIFPAKGLIASKARDAREKATSAKQGMRVESSDEGEGRSSLGRAKKLNSHRKAEAFKQPKKRASDSDASEEGKPRLGSAKKRKIDTSAEDSAEHFGQDTASEDFKGGIKGPGDFAEPKPAIITNLAKETAEKSMDEEPEKGSKQRKKLKKKEKRLRRKLKDQEASKDM